MIQERISTEIEMKRGLVVHGVYRHFKGNSYIVEDVAINSETSEGWCCAGRYMVMGFCMRGR